MQSACAVLYNHVWPVWLYHVFLRYLINGTIFGKKVIEHKMCFDFLYNFCLKHFSLYKEFSEIFSKTYTGLPVKYPLFLAILMKLEFSQQVFEKSSNIRFNENTVNGNRVVPCGRTDGRTDIIVTFRNFGKAPKMSELFPSYLILMILLPLV
jgi:hypothetical protein